MWLTNLSVEWKLTPDLKGHHPRAMPGVKSVPKEKRVALTNGLGRIPGCSNILKVLRCSLVNLLLDPGCEAYWYLERFSL